MTLNIITSSDIDCRNRWISEIRRLSGNFGVDSARLNDELTQEINSGGISSLLAHIRLCGAIPECYRHDSSEEKLYSKYTDSVISAAFTKIGLSSIVLQERADSADVQCVGSDYSFVADAKAFRLSRTAKNQKDFKVQAMANWKRGNPFAIVVCPVYQLPTRASQIYDQAIARNVCILSYSHLAVLAQLANVVDCIQSTNALKALLSCISILNPSKDASPYWRAINHSLITSHPEIPTIWQNEKLATQDSIVIAKEEALTSISNEQRRILRMSREQALEELIKTNNFTNRKRVIESVSDSGILSWT